MRYFEAGDRMEKVPGVVWVVAIGVVTIVAGGLWLVDWLSSGT